MRMTRFFIALQHILPHHCLSRIAGYLCDSDIKPVKKLLIYLAIKKFGIYLEEAEKDNPDDYATFNEFFTRRLKPGARPLAEGEDTLIAPADGTASAFGPIKEGRLMQAKGHDFSLQALLGDDADSAGLLHNGRFLTIYLAPRDYHRVHMPAAGRLLQMSYIPGSLFSVNQQTATGIENLFARNERVVLVFETAFGIMPVVLVGAMLVASIVTPWHGVVAPSYNKTIQTWDYHGNPLVFNKGDELGYFRFGSTVITCLPDRVALESTLEMEQTVKMGQAIGHYDS